MRYATSVERFEIGDYPMVCAGCGNDADHHKGFRSLRSEDWPWFLFPLHLFWFALAAWPSTKGTPIGRLPLCESCDPRRIGARWRKRERAIVLRGVHPGFVAATKAAQAN